MKKHLTLLSFALEASFVDRVYLAQTQISSEVSVIRPASIQARRSMRLALTIWGGDRVNCSRLFGISISSASQSMCGLTFFNYSSPSMTSLGSRSMTRKSVGLLHVLSVSVRHMKCDREPALFLVLLMLCKAISLGSSKQMM